MLNEALKNINHHAYGLQGSENTRKELIEILREKHKVITKGNPDFFERIYESFTIDDARELRSLHDTKPMYDGAKKIFVLEMHGITLEAQNALLKLLEEPGEYAHFFLIIPSAYLFLPTVRSRLQMIGGLVSEQGSSELIQEVRNFIILTPAKRLEYIKELLDEVSKEKKTKQQVIDFLNNLETIIHKERGVKSGRRALENIEIARKYINDRAPSLKMLLEYVALSLD